MQHHWKAMNIYKQAFKTLKFYEKPPHKKEHLQNTIETARKPIKQNIEQPWHSTKKTQQTHEHP